MDNTRDTAVADRMKIVVNGKIINLIFQPDPNVMAAVLVKDALINTYMLNSKLK